MNVAWISDMDIIGSGYRTLAVPLLEGLVKEGFEVKVIGFGYNGTQHNHNLSIIPAQGFEQALGILHNLEVLWGVDVVIFALDLPVQRELRKKYAAVYPDKLKNVGILPIESDPLSVEDAMYLSSLDGVFIISEFGTKLVKDVGIDATHLRVGVDTQSYRHPTKDERNMFRGAFGYSEDDFIVLTIADNQERKNLSSLMESFAMFIGEFSNVDKKPHLCMVTREFNSVGWNLRGLASELGFIRNFQIIERGMEFSKLWGVYAMSDIFVLPSKAEGLGLPVLEAMSVGLPVVGTACTGILEHLLDGSKPKDECYRGFPVPYDYMYRDPFGNSRRYFIDRDELTQTMKFLYTAISSGVYNKDIANRVGRATEYVYNREWDKAVKILSDGLKKFEVTNEQK